jgi:hypothetical protein
MSDEKRLNQIAETGEVVPIAKLEAAESKLAEVEGEREKLRELAIVNGGESARHAERADKAEADLARVEERLEKLRTDLIDGGDPDYRYGYESAIEDALAVVPVLVSPAQEQPRYTATDVLMLMTTEPALQAGADAICVEKPAGPADRNEVCIEIEAAHKVAFPQPNTPTEEGPER